MIFYLDSLNSQYFFILTFLNGHVIKFLNFLIAVLDLSQSLLSQTTYSFLSYAPSLIFPKKFLIAKLVRSVRLESSNPSESILLFSVLFGCHPKKLVFVLCLFALHVCVFITKPSFCLMG